MGGQVSSFKGKLGSSEAKKRGNRGDKVKISILAFEVANVMSKSIVLWQSLSDQEILRLRTEVIKAEGVLKLVSDSEAALLGLACREKLQDLMALAGSVARLGKKCQEPALQGFEHVFNDVLKQNIDVSALEFSVREMESKVKKMERYIASTSNLYQELEILADLEQAVRRIQDGDDQDQQRDNLNALEQKISWQRQEIKYLRDMSLWNRTYDKIVMLLARTICTIHGRIVCVFGPPASFEMNMSNGGNSGPMMIIGMLRSNGECNRFSQLLLKNGENQEENQQRHSQILLQNGSAKNHQNHHQAGSFLQFCSSQNSSTTTSSSAAFVEACSNGFLGPSSSPSPSSGTDGAETPFQASSPGDSDLRRLSADVAAVDSVKAVEDCSSKISDRSTGAGCYRNGSTKSMGQCSNGANSNKQIFQQNGRFNRLFFDPKFLQQAAPSSTLGGSALALHYANVIIIVEKMVKFPQLVGNDARDDLYRMLPKTVRIGLRSRLRTCFRTGDSILRLDAATALAWRENLDHILGWLAPLAHNMIRWQSEHNFEQQVVSRTNVLLLQTLYFADQGKAEAAIVELLVGLNYLCWYEKEMKANMPLDYAAASKDLDEYLDWQF